MVDWIKAWLMEVDIQKLVDNPLLDFKTDFSISTGVIEEKKVCSHYKNLKIFIVAGKYVYLEGSLHRYCKGNNAGRYTFSELTKTLIELSKLLDFDLSKAKIRNFEFGVNIPSPICSKELMNSIVCYKSKVMKSDNIMLRHDADRYAFKFYSKSEQMLKDGLVPNGDILRIEYKVKKMIQVKSNGILYLSDLTDQQKIESLQKHLSRSFNNLLFSDMTVLERLDPMDRIRMLEGSNIKYLQYYKGVSSPKQYSRKLNKYKKLLQEKSTCDFLKLKTLLEKEFYYLTHN